MDYHGRLNVSIPGEYAKCMSRVLMRHVIKSLWEIRGCFLGCYVRWLEHSLHWWVRVAHQYLLQILGHSQLLLCSSTTMIYSAMTFRVSSSTDVLLFASHSMSMVPLSFCNVSGLLSTLIDTLYESLPPSDSGPHSWDGMLIAWLCSSTWHSTGSIGRLLVTRRE